MNDDKDKPIIQPDDPIIPKVEPTPHDPVLQQQTESTAVTVDTESLITPISKKEIPQVDADSWNNMTVGELYEQLNVLEQRKYYCQRYSPMIVNDIEQGIKRIQLLIKIKHGNEVKLL